MYNVTISVLGDLSESPIRSIRDLAISSVANVHSSVENFFIWEQWIEFNINVVFGFHLKQPIRVVTLSYDQVIFLYWH